MKTAVIYARYSSDNQTEQSIEGQLRVCQDYAKNHDILILDTYIDRAMTGTNDNRPDFQRMIKDSYRKEWDYILVYKLDRFSRDKYATAIHKRTLKNNGVKLISAMENIPDTPEGIILESLLEGMNQYYSAELSQKVKRGMKETRLKGNYQGGAILYGYKLDGRKIVIDDYRAQAVVFMYEQYSKGVYVKDIIKALTAKGYLYKGKPFKSNIIYNILKNEKYSGIYRHGNEVVDNMYPQIISRELMDDVRKIAKANSHGKRSVEVVYLLRHKMKCGLCGSSITAETGTSKSGKVKRYYKCLGRKRHSGCKKAMVRKDELEKLILDVTVKQLSSPKVIDKVVDGLIEMQERQLQANSVIAAMEKEIRQTETAISNIMAAIESGVFTGSTARRLKELESRQEELERQILIERSKQAVKLKESDIRKYYEQALRSEPQMLINFLIKEIILYDDKIEIYLNSPIRTNPDGGTSDDDTPSGLLFYSEIIETGLIQMQIEMYV